jgi:hypothetical protein
MKALQSLSQQATSTMKTFQLVSFFALIASALSFTPAHGMSIEIPKSPVERAERKSSWSIENRKAMQKEGTIKAWLGR